MIEIERLGLLNLDSSQRDKLTTYHDGLLRELAGRFDVDVSESQRQLSWGMRIVSFLGAIALCAAAYFFVHRFWGLLTVPVQVALLAAAPLGAVLLTEFAARREKTLYFASLGALVALACFILNLSLLGVIFNITPTQNALLPWAAFAFIMAYAYGLRLLLVGGILCLVAYLSATTGTWSGCYWLSFGERPENFILSGFVLFVIPLVAPHRKHHDFPAIFRLFGLLTILLPILLLANWGEASYLMIPASTVEAAYQIAGFALSALAIWIGIRRGWSGVTNLGSTFFVILLYTKFYDWWWDWMPKYLFFAVLGAVAILLLAALKRLRASSQRATV